MTLYKIVRFYFIRDFSKPKVIKRGLTLKQAMKHCQDPETSSSTCKKAKNLQRTKVKGPWFDGFTEDKDETKSRRG